MNENIIIINTIMEILDQQAEKGKGMRMMLVNSSLAFFFFPLPRFFKEGTTQSQM